MTPEKLEALRYKASREDTPIEEARNAALAYVRGMSANSDDKSPKALVLEAERDRLQKELTTEKDYSHRLAVENNVLRNTLEQWVRAFTSMDKASQIVASPPPKRQSTQPEDPGRGVPWPRYTSHF